ncbi:MAG: hypothetical protein ABI776_12615, partial [Nocardioidaceae bacterium]
MVTSAKQTETTTPTAFELPSIEDATQQMRDLNEKMIESSKNVALTALDAFEKALQSVGDLEKKAASSTQVEWITAAATSHAKFMS